jgi:3-methyladenine DNA glycosylase AlkD
MPSSSKPTGTKRKAVRPKTGEVDRTLASLERAGSKKVRDEMAPRYGIIAAKAYGTPVGKIRLIAKSIGPDHELATALWKTGIYEARMLAAFVADPARVTRAEMDRWCRDFDNWAICDTVCFHLFDRTAHAFAKIDAWSSRKEEFVRRAAFALLASVALHDKKVPDEPFLRTLPLIERAAEYERNFVKMGVSWALRGIGKRNANLKAAAAELALRLSQSEHEAARWIGKDALREFAKR